MKVTIDERDRLVHTLLQEALGGDIPPDVTAGVLQRTRGALMDELSVAHVPPAAPTQDAPSVAHPAGTLASLHFRRPWLIPSAAVAAVAVLAVGLWAIFAPPAYPSPAASGQYRVVGGGPVERGAVIATDDSNAKVVLGGYCHVDISPQSRLSIQGTKRAEEIFLETGLATCEVNRNVGTFAVRTQLGTVWVTGTKFTVHVSKDEGDSTMSGKLVRQNMIVKVLVGSVMLSGAWGSMALSAGQEKTIGHAYGATTGPCTTQPATLKGKIGGISGNKIDFLTWPGGKLTHTVITVNDSTTITLDGNPATLSAVKAGLYATATLGAGGVATTLELKTPGESTTKPATTKPAMLIGNIYAINGAKLDIITYVNKQPVHKTVVTDDKTVVTIDGQPQLVSALKAGLYVHVTAGDGGVITIDAHTPTHK
jgi:hypothetical protein